MVNANKSKSVSQQQQVSQSTAESSGWNAGANQSFNLQGSQQGGSNFGQSSQDIWGGQAPALQQLYGAAQSLLGGAQPAGAEGVGDAARSAWMQQLTPGGNPYFSQSVQGAIDAATRGFTQGVLPQLTDQGVQAGAYGGVRDQLARGQAAGQFGEGLANMVGQMSSQQYGADQSRALQALGMAPGLQNMAYQPLQQAASMIGGPTVLGQSQSGGSSFGSSFGQGGSTGWTAGENLSNAQSSSSGFGGTTSRSGGIGILSK